MTWPFTPHTTHSDNTVPKITADEMNQIQAGINAAAYPQYLSRPEVQLYCIDGAQPVLKVSPLILLDSATSEYRYASFSTVTLDSNTHLAPTPGANWPADSWCYVYARCTNGVAAIEVRTTAPTTFAPDGTGTASPLFQGGPTETRRYLGCFYSGSGSAVRSFSMLNGAYSYLDSTFFLLAGSAGNVAYQTVALAAFTPPHAHAVQVQGVLTNTDTGSDQTLYVQPSTFTAFGTILANAGNKAGGGTDIVSSGTLDLPLVGATSIRWKTTSATCSMSLLVLGFTE